MELDPLVLRQKAESLVRVLAEPRPMPDESNAWPDLVAQAGKWGMESVAACAIRPVASARQRAWCNQVLERSWRRHGSNLLFVCEVVAKLNESGIDPIVLKGPLLAQRHYKPPFARKPSVDIDLAIREENIPIACNALGSMGYSPSITLDEAKTFGYDLALYHETKPRIELHFRLTHGATGISVEEFFSRTRPVNLPNGAAAQILEEADEILHLVLHYAHHRFPLLFNLYEIRKIWRGASPEVQSEVIRRAIHYRFFGAFVVTDIAFRVIWREEFLPSHTHWPRTWLHWRLTEDFYWRCVQWSASGAGLTLANRLSGRWLDLQITDGPSDALKFFRMFLNVARFRLSRRGWGKLRYRRLA